VNAFRRSRRLLILVFGLAGLSFLSVGAGLQAENHDAFCASCHTEPETTYVERAQAAPADLASFHTSKDIQCIQCHSGPGFVGRLTTLPLAAWDATRFFTRTYEQPAHLHAPLHDGTCLQCHGDALQQRGFQNHFHSELAAPGKAPISVECAGCHSGHVLPSDLEPFMARDQVEIQCNACHRERGEGPSEFRLQHVPYAPAVRRLF
jgi:hypothetical protein